ncbi:hypothetical protein CAMRE0001_0485 [Campylobacter rectus RM3267]|uniref:Uncharacterized protein n=1 Tax=Campylobacter rectus RM3267 TaxID=553218 RepID=B9D2W3_CAMRE|nr:hypothetical protein CAMRE0001_0485 [Campylobacter rectus RM3267]
MITRGKKRRFRAAFYHKFAARVNLMDFRLNSSQIYREQISSNFSS